MGFHKQASFSKVILANINFDSNMYMGAGWVGFSRTENKFLGLSQRVKKKYCHMISNVPGGKTHPTQREANMGKFQVVSWLYDPKWQPAESVEKPILRENIPQEIN